MRRVKWYAFVIGWITGALAIVVGQALAGGWGVPPAEMVHRSPVTMVAVPGGCQVHGDYHTAPTFGKRPEVKRDILTLRTMSAGPIRRICDHENGVALYVWQGVGQTVAKRKGRTDPR